MCRWESALPYEMLLKSGRTLFSPFFLIPLKSSCGFMSMAGHVQRNAGYLLVLGSPEEEEWRLGTPLGRVGVTELPLSVSPCIFPLLRLLTWISTNPGALLSYIFETLCRQDIICPHSQALGFEIPFFSRPRLALTTHPQNGIINYQAGVRI